ncbi:hypothetical protein BKA82DRAFT_4018865 [Pisolithus tinctorius]|nr:hypothetical protein BKA82DRAFT_4018865 [Pisolithus tinctorius]
MPSPQGAKFGRGWGYGAYLENIVFSEVNMIVVWVRSNYYQLDLESSSLYDKTTVFSFHTPGAFGGDEFRDGLLITLMVVSTLRFGVLSGSHLKAKRVGRFADPAAWWWKAKDKEAKACKLFPSKVSTPLIKNTSGGGEVGAPLRKDRSSLSITRLTWEFCDISSNMQELVHFSGPVPDTSAFTAQTTNQSVGESDDLLPCTFYVYYLKL